MFYANVKQIQSKRVNVTMINQYYIWSLQKICIYELVQKCKPSSYLLLKQEPEINDKILNILDDFWEKLNILQRLIK